MSYFKPTVIKEAGEYRTSTTDMNQKQLLKEILVALKKIEIHMSFMTRKEVSDRDIE